MCCIPGLEVFVDLKTNPKFIRNGWYQLHLQFGGFMHRFCHILFIFHHFCWIWETIFRYKRHMPKYSLLSHHQTISVLCFKKHLQKNHGLRFYCWFLLIENHPNRVFFPFFPANSGGFNPSSRSKAETTAASWCSTALRCAPVRRRPSGRRPWSYCRHWKGWWGCYETI